jgi:tetratricopeptide (TPR) repeat protein
LNLKATKTEGYFVGSRFTQRASRVLLPLLLILGCPSAFAQSAPSVQAVVSAIQEARYNDALSMSEVLLRSAPNSPQLLSLKATALERSGQESEALTAYRHALRIAPEYIPALEGAAQIEYKAQSADAIPTLHHIISLRPDNQVAHAMLAVLEYRNKQYGIAVEDFAAAKDVLVTQPASIMDWAIALARLDRDSDAAQKFQDLLALKPESTIVRYDLALEQWRSSSAADALATLEPLLNAQAADARSLRLAAAIHESRNETPQAVELLRAAILADPGDEANYLDFAIVAFTHGSYSVGVDMINAGLTRVPNSASLYMARGVLYGENGDFEKALDDFEHAHRIDPAYSMAASAEGIAFSQRHDHEAALEKFRREVREHPNDALGYYLLAEALSWAPASDQQNSTSNTSTEAIAMATKAIQLDPHLREAWDLLASQLLQAGEMKRAADACKSALAIDPNDDQAIYTLMLASRKTASKDELRALVQRLTEVRKQKELANSQTKRYGRLQEEQ